MSARLSDRRSACLLMAALIGVCPFQSVLHADTWTGLGASGDWTDAGNWGGTAPLPGASLVFSGTVQTTTNNTYTADTQFNGLAFDASATLFTLGGNSISLQGDLVNNATSNAHTLTLSSIHLMGNSNFNLFATTGSMAMSSNIDAGVAGPVTLNLSSSGGANTITGILSNGSASALTVNVATGTWAFNTATNTFSGNLTVGEGAILRADNGVGVSANAALLLNGGVLETATAFSRVTGTTAGKVQLTGGAAGFSARGGAVTVTLDGGSPVVWGSANFNTGTLTLQTGSANNTLTFANGIDLQGAARTISVNNSNTTNLATVSGAVTDSIGGGGITKAGTGLLALTGTNVFTGPLAINGGTVRADDGVGLPSAAGLSLNGGILETSANLTRAAGLGTGAGQVQVIGAAPGFTARTSAVSVGIGASNSTLPWGTAAFNPGTLTLQSSSASAPLTLNNGIDLQGGMRTVAVNNSNSTNTATVAGPVNDTVGGGGLTKIGSGTLVLGAVTSLPTLAANAGGVILPVGYAAGNIVLNGGSVWMRAPSGNSTFSVSGTASTGSLTIVTATPSTATMTLLGASNAGYVRMESGTLMASNTLGSGTLELTNNASNIDGIDHVTTLRVAGAPATLSQATIILNGNTSFPIRIAGDDNLSINGRLLNIASNGNFFNTLPSGKVMSINGEIDLSQNTSGRTLHMRGTGSFAINGWIANGPTGVTTNNNSVAVNGTTSTPFVQINATSLTYTGGTAINSGTVVFNFTNSAYLPAAAMLNTSTNSNYIQVISAGSGGSGGAVAFAGGMLNPVFLSRLAGAQTLVNNAAANSVATGALCMMSTTDAATSVDFNAGITPVGAGSHGDWGSMALGAAAGAYTYTGVLTPLNATSGQKLWRLGGGNGTMTFSQVMDNGSGSTASTLTVLGGGNGVLVLTGQSTYTGATSIAAFQTVKNGVDNALGTVGTLTLNGIYDLSGYNQTTRNLGGTGTLTTSTGSGILTVAPTNNSVFNGVVSGNVGIAQNGTGTVTLGGTVNYSGTSSVAGTMILGGTNNAVVSVSSISGTGKAQIATNINATTGAAAVGTLQIDANAVQTIRTGSGTSKVSTLTLAGGTGAWTSKLDITDNALVAQSVDATAKAAVIPTLVDQIKSGKNTGAWDGQGITSSSIVGHPNATMALVDNADLNLASLGSQSLDANSVIVTRAIIGDADLSGVVDLGDFNRWFSHVGSSTYSYAAGDFDMSGIVDLGDFNAWFSHVGVSSIGLQPAAGLSIGGASAVPEPASLAVLALGGAALLGRRRRSK